MAKARAAITCPITKLEVAYGGRGRPPVFHKSASAADRRSYRNGLAAIG